MNGYENDDKGMEKESEVDLSQDEKKQSTSRVWNLGY